MENSNSNSTFAFNSTFNDDIDVNKKLSRREKLEIWKECRKAIGDTSSTSSTETTLHQLHGNTTTSNNSSSCFASSSISSKTMHNRALKPLQQIQNKENSNLHGNCNKMRNKETLKTVEYPTQPLPPPISSSSSVICNGVEKSKVVDFEEYVNLKSKYRNLQKLYKSKMELLETLGKQFDATSEELKEKSLSLGKSRKVADELVKRVSALETEVDDHHEKLTSIQDQMKIKDDLIAGFAKDYISKAEYNEVLEEVTYLKQDNSDNLEIISELKMELEDAIEKLEQAEKFRYQVTEWKRKLSNYDEVIMKIRDLEDANLIMAIKLEENLRDVEWKDQEINKIREALGDTLSQNEKLYEMLNFKSSSSVETSEEQVQTEQVEEEKQVAHAQVETSGDYHLVIRESNAIFREFRNMKVGNDLMYQQMMEIQQKAKRESLYLHETIKSIERERDDHVEMYKQLDYNCTKQAETIRLLNAEIQKLNREKGNDVDNDEIMRKKMDEVFEQAEKMVMVQLEKLMEKNILLEEELKHERQEREKMEKRAQS